MGKQCKLNIILSNQSLDRPNEKIRLYVNGQQLFDKTMPVQDQHYYERLEKSVLMSEHVQIRIVALDSNMEANFLMDIRKDQYIYVYFYFNEDENRPGFSFSVNDELVGWE